MKKLFLLCFLVMIPSVGWAFNLSVNASGGSGSWQNDGTYRVMVGATVSFTSTPSGGTSPYAYSWNFDDPDSYQNGGATSQNPTHTFNYPGEHHVSLTVTDNVSSETTAILVIDVRAVDWTANVTGCAKSNSSECGGTYDFYCGAAGDGVTDDGPDLRSCVESLDLTNGGRIEFPAGTYLISTPKMNAGGTYRDDDNWTGIRINDNGPKRIEFVGIASNPQPTIKIQVDDTWSLVRSGYFSWSLSTCGTDTYYIVKDGSLNYNEATKLYENGSLMTEGTDASSLNAGEWVWGDCTGDGVSTRFYVRLSDGADPDTKPADYIESKNDKADDCLFTYHVDTSTSYFLLKNLHLLFDRQGLTAGDYSRMDIVFGSRLNLEYNTYAAMEDNSIENFSFVGDAGRIRFERNNITGWGVRNSTYSSTRSETMYLQGHSLYRQNYIASGETGHGHLVYSGPTSASTDRDYVYVVENYFDGINGDSLAYGMHFYGSSGAGTFQYKYVWSNVIKNTSRANLYGYYSATGGHDWEFKDNQLYKSLIQISRSTANTVVTGNHFEELPTNYCIKIGRSGNATYDVTATGNTFGLHAGSDGGGDFYYDTTDYSGTFSPNTDDTSTSNVADPGQIEYQVPTISSASSSSNVLTLSASDTGSGLGSTGRIWALDGGLVQVQYTDGTFSKVQNYSTSTTWDSNKSLSKVRVRDVDGNWTGLQNISTGSNPTISVSSSGNPSEDGATGTFTLYCSPDCAGEQINFTMSGMATDGVDYNLSDSSPVTITGASKVITLTPVDDTTWHENFCETITLTVGTGSGYDVGSPASATLQLKENDYNSTQVGSGSNSFQKGGNLTVTISGV